LRRERGFVLAFLAWGALSSAPLRFTPPPLVDLLTLQDVSMDNNKLTQEIRLTQYSLVRLLPLASAVSPSAFLRCAHYHIVFR